MPQTGPGTPDWPWQASPNSRPFSPNYYANLYIDISDTWSYKLAALNAYSEEMRDYPHSRSLEAIENLAKLRGNQVGLKMAEAFQIIRKIEY